MSGYFTIPKRFYQGQLGNAVADLYTAPVRTAAQGPQPKAILTEIIIANCDTATRTLTVYIVPSGGSTNAGTTIIPGVPVDVGMIRLTFATPLEAGDKIRGFCDTANKITLTIGGMELKTQ